MTAIELIREARRARRCGCYGHASRLYGYAADETRSKKRRLHCIWLEALCRRYYEQRVAGGYEE